MGSQNSRPAVQYDKNEGEDAEHRRLAYILSKTQSTRRIRGLSAVWALSIWFGRVLRAVVWLQCISACELEYVEGVANTCMSPVLHD